MIVEINPLGLRSLILIPQVTHNSLRLAQAGYEDVSAIWTRLSESFPDPDTYFYVLSSPEQWAVEMRRALTSKMARVSFRESPLLFQDSDLHGAQLLSQLEESLDLSRDAILLIILNEPGDIGLIVNEFRLRLGLAGISWSMTCRK
jgi:hypothetical protein